MASGEGPGDLSVWAARSFPSREGAGRLKAVPGEWLAQGAGCWKSCTAVLGSEERGGLTAAPRGTLRDPLLSRKAMCRAPHTN